MRFSTLAAVTLAALLALPTAAQVDSIPAQNGTPLWLDGGIAMHDDGQDFQGFSAATGAWTVLGPTGTTVVQRSDWVSLVQRPDGQLAFFLGRTGDVFLPPLAAQNFNTNAQRGVTGEIGYVTYPIGGGTWQLYCICAKGGQTWNFTEEITPHAARGAVVASDRLGAQQFHVGFAARTGYFETTPLENNFTRTYSGSGNLICVETPSQLHVFSGVHGQWNASSVPESFTVDDNVVLRRGWIDQADNTVRYGSFSAYGFGWNDVATGFDLDLVTPEEHTGSNWCCVRWTASTWWAIGARPHEDWTTTTLVGATLTGGDDGCILTQPGFIMRAFSGLRNEQWAPKLLVGAAAPIIETLEHAFYVIDGTEAYFYSPYRGGWTVPIGTVSQAASTRALGGTGGLVRLNAPFQVLANSCRSASLPAWPGGDGFSLDLHAADSIYAAVDPNDAHAVWVYDARDRAWQDRLYAGPNPYVQATGNVIAVSGALGTFAYSAQSGGWTQVEDPSGNAVVVGPGQLFVRENLAAVVDNGFVTVFGACDDVAVWYEYPESRDFHALLPPGPGLFSDFDATIRRPAGTFVANYYSNVRLSDGASVPLPVSGLLWINPFVAIDTFVTTVDDQRWTVPLPAGGPGLQQLWVQSVFSDPGGPQPFEFSNAPQSVVIF